jgi:hypothetical protein
MTDSNTRLCLAPLDDGDEGRIDVDRSGLNCAKRVDGER